MFSPIDLEDICHLWSFFFCLRNLFCHVLWKVSVHVCQYKGSVKPGKGTCRWLLLVLLFCKVGSESSLEMCINHLHYCTRNVTSWVTVDIEVSKRQSRLLKEIPVKVLVLFKYLQCAGNYPEWKEMRLSYGLHSLNHG